MSGNLPSSPSSSPRLPSPPPMAEDQSGAQSPSLTSSELNTRPLDFPAQGQAAASRRIRPGTKAIDMAEGPPLVELTEIDSAFQLTEHLKALHFSHTHPLHLPSITLPVTAPVALLLSTPPPGTDRALWLYELCRFLVQRVNTVVISLFADHPPCSASTCPEMRASEWQYLCAVHDPPKACCAIDYCCHTLDWAANVLTNPKHFPSRLALGVEHTAPQHQVRQLTNIFRRVYRIFAHAWFSHRDMFWRVEGKTGLYIFFKTVCDLYNLLPDDGYTIPAEAEAEPQDSEQEPRKTEVTSDGTSQDPTATTAEASAAPPPSILKRPAPSATPAAETTTNTLAATGATARRHRQTPSMGASPVETVMEENEDEGHPADLTRPRPTPEEEALPSAQHSQPSASAAQEGQPQLQTQTQTPILVDGPPSTDFTTHSDSVTEPPNTSTPASISASTAVTLGAGAEDIPGIAEGTAQSGTVPAVSRWEEAGPNLDDSDGDGNVAASKEPGSVATTPAEEDEL